MDDYLLQKRYEYRQKPKVCPECKSKRIAKILWGYPAYSEEMQKEIDEGKITLGGCCISPDDPTWQCADCEIVFYRKLDLPDGIDIGA